MVCAEFFALTRGLLSHPSKASSRRGLTAAPGTDASAIHGRLGAQVALLQSPILPAATKPYLATAPLFNLPVDKPHTRDLRALLFSISALQLRADLLLTSDFCPLRPRQYGEYATRTTRPLESSIRTYTL